MLVVLLMVVEVVEVVVGEVAYRSDSLALQLRLITFDNCYYFMISVSFACVETIFRSICLHNVGKV